MDIIVNEKVNFNNSLSLTGEYKNYIYKSYAFIKLIIKIIGLLRFLLKLLKLGHYFRGWKIGDKTTEYGLKLN